MVLNKQCIVGFVGLIITLALSSCSNSSNKNSTPDFLNNFIEEEASRLTDNHAQVNKTVILNGETENRLYSPDWTSELSFLNNYINEFRKNGELINSTRSNSGDTSIVTYQKSESESMLLNYLNDNILNISISVNRTSIFGSRVFYLRYSRGKGYTLRENTDALWFVENKLEIESNYKAQ